jgi:hypothetical protein
LNDIAQSSGTPVGADADTDTPIRQSLKQFCVFGKRFYFVGVMKENLIPFQM